MLISRLGAVSNLRFCMSLGGQIDLCGPTGQIKALKACERFGIDETEVRKRGESLKEKGDKLTQSPKVFRKLNYNNFSNQLY